MSARDRAQRKERAVDARSVCQISSGFPKPGCLSCLIFWNGFCECVYMGQQRPRSGSRKMLPVVLLIDRIDSPDRRSSVQNRNPLMRLFFLPEKQGTGLMCVCELASLVTVRRDFFLFSALPWCIGNCRLTCRQPWKQPTRHVEFLICWSKFRHLVFMLN